MVAKWIGLLVIGAASAGHAETTLINDDFSSGTVGEVLTFGAADDGQWYAESGSAWLISDGVVSNAGVSSDVSENEGALAQLVDLTGITNTNLSSLAINFSYQASSATEELYVHLWGFNVSTAPADTASMVNHGATAGNMWKNGVSLTAYNNGDLYNLGNLNGEFFETNIGAFQEAAVRIPATGTSFVNFSQTFNLSANTNGMDNITTFDYLVIGITRDATGTSPSITLDDFKLTVSDPSDNPRPEKPNFVMLLADDLGWQDIGCYDIDNNAIFDTPYMDQLATEGIKFWQAYSPACVCAPTRAAILTGKHPARNHFHTVSGGAACPQPSALSSRVMEPYHHRYLKLEDVTLPEMLGAEGYYNGHIGKWHMEGAAPTEHGFDYSENDRGATITIGDDRTTGFSTDLDENGFAFDQTTENAMIFLDEAVASDQPFFCYYASYLVHGPWHMRTERLLIKYAEKMGYDYPLTGNEFFAPGQNNPYYAAMVEVFDYNIHRIMTYLKETEDPRWPGHKLIENTYVFLTSDNGGMENGDPNGKVTDNYPLDQGKIFQEEGGVRVPFIALGPGIPAHVDSDVMINGLDFIPTMLALAGIPVPNPEIIDGCDISDLLLTDPQDGQLVRESDGEVRDTMYWHFPNTRLYSTIRKGGWKLFRNYDYVNNSSKDQYRVYELYDTNGVPVDLEEDSDVVDDDPTLTASLAAELDAWLVEVDANIPYYNPNCTTSLPNQDQVPGIITNGNAGRMVWVEYETDKAAVKKVDLIYTLNGDSTKQEWLEKRATITEPGRAEVEVPEGTTHYVFNLIDTNNFLVSYPDLGTFSDDTLDSVLALPYIEMPYVSLGPQDLIFSEDFSSATLGINLQRDSIGFCAGSSSAWMIDNGMLSNTSLVNSTVSEGAAGCVIDLSILKEAAVSEFTLSFDYTLAETIESLYVHIWGYVDHSSTPTTSILSHGASNGNAWENASPTYMSGYNFGNSNGVFNSTEGIASDAAVSRSGFHGETSFIQTFDLSEWTTAPNTLGEYDYLVLGFTRNFGGSAPAATVDNVKITVPTSDTYRQWAFDENLTEEDPTADPDGDELDNLAEYALGGDPNVVDAEQLMPVLMSGTEGPEFIFRRRLNSSDTLSYRLATTTNMISGAWVTNEFTDVTSGALGSTVELVTNRVDTTGKENEFMKLTVELK